LAGHHLTGAPGYADAGHGFRHGHRYGYGYGYGSNYWPYDSWAYGGWDNSCNYYGYNYGSYSCSYPNGGW
jgi:hypothetical protein